MPFFDDGEASDPAYEAVRDGHHLGDAKALIEHLWTLYAPYADRTCRADAKAHFHQRTWELYLGNRLRNHGFELHKVSDEGAEFFIEIGGRKVWVEAVVPGPGEREKADFVPPLALAVDVGQEVPEEQIILRFTQALSEKCTRYEVARQRGIIGALDGYIVAVNGHGASQFHAESEVPFIIKAVLAVGPLTVTFSSSAETSDSFYQRRAQVVKHNLAPVSTKAFLSPDYAGISGLLYSSKDIVNVREPFGSEMFFLHNPLANNPIPGGTFRFQCEYRYSRETQQLLRCDWRKGPC